MKRKRPRWNSRRHYVHVIDKSDKRRKLLLQGHGSEAHVDERLSEEQEAVGSNPTWTTNRD